jgi:acetyl-CoA carboxylase biotin carboxylase subunit
MKIDKLLIANRGEIALRVMRTAREMGIATVAVYSDADRTSPFVRFADEAVRLGPPPSNQSYLKMDLIIEAALKTGAQAIHPGYGFLSENAEFSEKVEKAGLIFIGPRAHAIRTMGDKLSAKAAVAKFDVPLVPGSDGAITSIEEARDVLNETGFPVLIKASAGGGGKGMRIVEREEDFAEQMELAVNEATSAFGNGEVFVEKYVSSPRHIEFQILADEHGNIVHVFDRECSVQRRHQKVIEEAPSCILSDELRKEMGDAAVNVARACNYRGAGTVEFIFDEQHNFYFLEMNTRLQVEHPVSEMITGIDLVREMIYIAEGKPLSIKQEDLSIRGHAIELRVYAENPHNNFLPDTGSLETYRRPDGPGVRVDDGFEEGMEVPIYYDPMISKLCTYAENRETAIDRMIRAIDEYRIVGVETTLGFGKFVMQHEAFRSGNFDTHFVAKYFHPDELIVELSDTAAKAGALIASIVRNGSEGNVGTLSTESQKPQHSAWRSKRGALS